MLLSGPLTVLQPVGAWVVVGGSVGGGVGGGGGGPVEGCGGGVGGGGGGPVEGCGSGGWLPDSLGHPSSEPVCNLTQSRTSGYTKS